MEKRNKTFHTLPALAVLIFFGIYQINAQRLAIRTFQTGDGLAHNNVKQIFQDAKGFLWIATWEGLSRFDGYNFTNYDTDDGLGHIFINDITADNHGRLWVATNGGGVSMLIDEPPENSSTERKKFISFQIAEGGENNTANAVNRILFDAENRLWCATDDGLYRAANLEVADYGFERVTQGTQPVITNAALRDHRGRLWFSVREVKKNRIVQVADGKTTGYETREADSAEPLEIHTIIETGDGRILAASAKNIFEFIEPAQEGERGAWRKLSIALPPSQIQTIASAPDGGLWISTGGLVRFLDGRQTLYTTANGLGANSVSAVFYDREGNLWIGTSGGGLSKLSGESIVTYTVAQGLPAPDVYRVIEDRSGRIYAQIGGCRLTEITEDSRIVTRPDSEELSSNFCLGQVLLQDTRGNWWFNSRHGVKFSTDATLNLQRGRLVLDENKQPFNYSEIYEDATGNIWLTNMPKRKLYRIAKGNPQNLSVAAENVQAEFIIRDKNSGTVWIASRATLWRVRDGGEVKAIEKIEGLPVLQPRSLFQDSRGRIWVGTRYHGAIVTEEPEADNPRFSHFTANEGLASNAIWEIAEDDQGRIYFGTGRGVDQLDAPSGKIHHFTADEGAINSAVAHLLKDRPGNLWASTQNGLMRINPRSLRQNTDAPPIFISQIRVAGEELPLAETGAAMIPAVELSGNNVAIRFVGLSFQSENALRYEYKLDGVDTDWVAVGGQREVNFANLGAGDYRFEVRAVNAENIKSPSPAAFEFRILRPVYLRWWFLLLAAGLVALLVYWLYRNRLRRLLEIERTRTRIATDLHDDIGANLSKISLLSEIVKMQMTGNNAESQRLLTTIAEVSRSSVDAMRDIVWAINPNRDSVLEMTRKMRQYAEETFVPKNVAVRFNAPEDGANVRLPMDIRRELFLIFKEAINNAARHSQCSLLEIDFRASKNEIFLQIADDGCGFEVSEKTYGNGLSNMRARTEKISGSFVVKSETGVGTKVEIRV